MLKIANRGLKKTEKIFAAVEDTHMEPTKIDKGDTPAIHLRNVFMIRTARQRKGLSRKAM